MPSRMPSILDILGKAFPMTKRWPKRSAAGWAKWATKGLRKRRRRRRAQRNRRNRNRAPKLPSAPGITGTAVPFSKQYGPWPAPQPVPPPKQYGPWPAPQNLANKYPWLAGKNAQNAAAANRPIPIPQASGVVTPIMSVFVTNWPSHFKIPWTHGQPHPQNAINAGKMGTTSSLVMGMARGAKAAVLFSGKLAVASLAIAIASGRFAKRIVDAQEHLAKFNGAIGKAWMELSRARLFREKGLADAGSKTSSELIREWNKTEEAYQGLRKEFEVVKNLWTTAVANGFKTIAPTVEKYVHKVEDLIGMQQDIQKRMGKPQESYWASVIQKAAADATKRGTPPLPSEMPRRRGP